MITEKHFWKSIYTWIKYLNYQVVHRNQDDTEVWLANKSNPLQYLNLVLILHKK